MTQEELSGYRQLRRDRHETEQIIKDIETSIDGLRAAVLDGLPHGSGRRRGLDEIVMRYEAQTERYLNKLADINSAMQRIEDAVGSLPPKERDTMFQYYIAGQRKKTFYQVARITHYSERQVRRYHERAMIILQTWP